MSVNLTSGSIYALADIDATAYGSLPADTAQILQQGFAAAQAVLLTTAGLSSGQSRWALIQAGFSQVDDIPSDDPTSGVLPYVNPGDPGGPPWSGPNNTGAAQNTRRRGICTISVIYGTPATTGSEVPPNPSFGNVGLYLIDLTFGQTQVTGPEILVAGPSVGTGVPTNYPDAPFLAGLLAGGVPSAGTSHHLGKNGHAPKVNLATETQGQLPAGNLTGFTSTLGVGAFVNKIRNGTFLMTGRGASVTISPGSPGFYGLDGMIVGCAGAAVTVTQTASIGGGPFSMTITGGVGVTDCWVIFPLESLASIMLAGKTTLLQFLLQNSAGVAITPTVTLKYPSALDTWTSSTAFVSGAATDPATVAPATTALLSYFASALPGQVANGMSVRVDFGGVLNGPGRALSLGAVDMRESATAVPSLPEMRPIFLEELECERYLPVIYAGGPGVGSITTPWLAAGGAFDAPNTGGINVQLFRPTRVSIVGLIISSIADFALNYRGAVIGLTSLTMNTYCPIAVSLIFTTTGLSAVSGEATNLVANDVNARLILYGAEIIGPAI